ncbi:MAG: hypothetical protein FWG31_09130 [Oscillospiraceae bacterium]|nr:hypothetical protein [Oscillospiraceae bacterium]
MKKSRVFLLFISLLVGIQLLRIALYILSEDTSGFAGLDHYFRAVSLLIKSPAEAVTLPVWWILFRLGYLNLLPCILLCMALFIIRRVIHKHSGYYLKNLFFLPGSIVVLTMFLYIHNFRSYYHRYVMDMKKDYLIDNWSNVIPFYVYQDPSLLAPYPSPSWAYYLNNMLLTLWISVSICFLVWLGAQAGKAIWPKIKSKSKPVLWFVIPLVVVPVSFLCIVRMLSNDLLLSSIICLLICMALHSVRAALRKYSGFYISNRVIISCMIAIITLVLYILIDDSNYSALTLSYPPVYTSYDVLSYYITGDPSLLFSPGSLTYSMSKCLFCMRIAALISLLVWLGAQAGKAVWNKMRRKSV